MFTVLNISNLGLIYILAAEVISAIAAIVGIIISINAFKAPRKHLANPTYESFNNCYKYKKVCKVCEFVHLVVFAVSLLAFIGFWAVHFANYKASATHIEELAFFKIIAIYIIPAPFVEVILWFLASKFHNDNNDALRIRPIEKPVEENDVVIEDVVIDPVEDAPEAAVPEIIEDEVPVEE